MQAPRYPSQPRSCLRLDSETGEVGCSRLTPRAVRVRLIIKTSLQLELLCKVVDIDIAYCISGLMIDQLNNYRYLKICN